MGDSSGFDDMFDALGLCQQADILEWVTVEDEHRRLGIGRRLVEDARRWLGEVGITSLKLQVYAKNEYACPGAADAAEPDGGNLPAVDESVKRRLRDRENAQRLLHAQEIALRE